MQVGRIRYGLARLQDVIDVTHFRPMVLLDYGDGVASMLRSRHPAGMYTRLFRPAPRALTLCAGYLLAASGISGNVMARLVMKFGGTSVADLDRIRNVARHVKREVDAGYDVAVDRLGHGRNDQPAGGMVPAGRHAT